MNAEIALRDYTQAVRNTQTVKNNYYRAAENDPGRWALERQLIRCEMKEEKALFQLEGFVYWEGR